VFPILFRIGSYTVYSYTVLLVLGLVAGTWRVYCIASRRMAQPAVVLDMGFWALIGGVFGARAGYVLANWAYFRDHIERALDIRGGGLSWHGALLGAGLAFAIWYVVRSRSGGVPGWAALLDAAAPGIALGGALGWTGCLLTGACYGAEATGFAAPLSWLSARLPDIYGVDASRFLTQPWMIACCLVLWGELEWLSRRPAWVPGTRFVGLLLLYALADLGVWFLRGDGTWRYGLWLAQWADVAQMAIAIALGGWAIAEGTSRPLIDAV
jgi:phosphatidylglycerol:prolipoprotein diacylglycerol transferase